MIKTIRTAHLIAGALLLAISLMPARASVQSSSPAGVWDATVDVGGVLIPFRFEITGSGTAFTGSFLDGELKMS